MIPEALDGKRIAITGSTGFLGTALVERLLRSVPGCELVLLVRPGKRSSVAQRARREIFRNDAFDRLRRDMGTDAVDEMVDRRVTVIAGDVGTDGPARPAGFAFRPAGRRGVVGRGPSVQRASASPPVRGEGPARAGRAPQRPAPPGGPPGGGPRTGPPPSRVAGGGRRAGAPAAGRPGGHPPKRPSPDRAG